MEATPMKASARVVIVVAVSIATSLGLVASSPAQQPIRIGASLSKTGTYAEFGQTLHRGYQVCIKHANERGGVLGRKIELLVEDDQSKAATAVGIYERLIAREKVDAVFSPYSSPLTDAVADITEKYRLPMVAVNLWYHVGPANELPGRTGFAHLFEHMMFEGSRLVPGS
jgi:branched-chain amino acid transport system substrate-binding protein